MAANGASTSQSICGPGMWRRMSVTTGIACTTSPIDEVLTIRSRTRRSGLAWRSLHQRRVEARVVVHLELAVDLEVGAAGRGVGQQRVQAAGEVGALLLQARRA